MQLDPISNSLSNLLELKSQITALFSSSSVHSSQGLYCNFWSYEMMSSNRGKCVVRLSPGEKKQPERLASLLFGIRAHLWYK